MSDTYPDELVRGVSRADEQFITPEGYPTQAVFRFDQYDAHSRKNDGYRELSINWLDDDGAITTLLAQRNTRSGAPQFAGGYCRLSRLAMHGFGLRDYMLNNHLSYERRPIPSDDVAGSTENRYHGNILMKEGLSKAAVTNIQVTLAGLSGMVVPRPDSAL